MLPLYICIPIVKLLTIRLFINPIYSNFTISLEIKFLDFRNLSRSQYKSLNGTGGVSTAC